MTKRMTCVVLLLCSAAISASAQTFTVLVSFDGPNGIFPFVPLTQAFDGNFYGTTFQGGSNCSPDGCGTVFKISSTGSLTTLYNFCAQTGCVDGTAPEAGMVLALDGNFYGTTAGGGTSDNGTIFSITPGGSLTTLHSFCSQPNCTDGTYPLGLIQASDGNFYGVTNGGGTSTFCNGFGCGTIFKMTPAGRVTILYSFCSQTGCADGDAPIAPPTQGTDGDFYGTTTYEGAYAAGTVYRITSGGDFTSLYSFCAQGIPYCPDGAYSGDGALVQTQDGSFYGTTWQGGERGGGTAYRITTKGVLTTLRSFCNGTEGAGCEFGGRPLFGLIQGSDGNLYGANSAYGPKNAKGGVAFELNLPSQAVALHSFCAQPECADGSYPGALIQGTDGNLYGTTDLGGTSDYGIIYSLSLGLAPFVETLPTSRAVGKQAIILGNGLSGTTGISFNGVPATTFTIASDTQITATVPAGATTGFVTVTTASGTLTSNKQFRVMP